MGIYHYAAPDLPDKELQAADLGRNIANNTSAHGMPHIAKAQGKFKKIYWSFLSMAFLGVMSYNIYVITDLFFQYPVNVVISLENEEELAFPAVTVCNMSPVRKSLWDQYETAVTSAPTSSKRRRRKRSTTIGTRACPAGWTETPDTTCIITEAGNMLSWTDARDHCQGMLGDLAAITSQDLQDAAGAISTGADRWIGLFQGWGWQDGAPLTWSSWADDTGGPCVYTDHLGDWTADLCNISRPVICSIDQTGSCPGGWSDSGTRCYYLPAGNHTWDDGNDACASATSGSVLAKVDSQYEKNYLVSNVMSVGDYWIGIYDNPLSNWSDGSVLSYTQWRAGEPVSGPGCTNIRVSDEWEISSCDSAKRFICQKAKPCVSTGTGCITDCSSQSDGGYQTCERCDVYVTCTNQTLTMVPCASGLIWDDVLKFCVAVSSTCLECETVEVSTSSYVTESATSSSADSCSCCCGATYVYVPPSGDNNETSSTTTILQQEPTIVEGSQYDRPALTEDFAQAEEVIESLAEIDVTEKQGLGYTIQDVILDCQFEGSSCYYSDFDSFYNPIHGNCYTFNSGRNRTLKTAKHTGRRYGLHLTMNLNQDEYTTQAGDTAGIRLVVHPGDKMAFPEDEGITVGPGQATYVGLKQVNILRRGSPYGECVADTEVDYKRNVYEEFYGVNYSVMGCQKTCLQREIIAQCDCADAYYPTEGAAFDKTVPVCSTSDITQGDCKYNVKKKFENQELACDCPNPCNSTLYTMDTSTGQWPSDVQRDTVLNRLGSSVASLFEDPNDPTKYTRNLLKVEVFYKEFNFETIKEVPSYLGGNYASDLGGVLGLWFGLSLLTLFEFFEFFMDLFVYGGRKCKKRPNKVKKLGRGDTRYSIGNLELTPDAMRKIQSASQRSTSRNSEKSKVIKRKSSKVKSDKKKKNDTQRQTSWIEDDIAFAGGQSVAPPPYKMDSPTTNEPGSPDGTMGGTPGVTGRSPPPSYSSAEIGDALIHYKTDEW